MAAYPVPNDQRRGTGGDTLGQMLVTLQQLSEQVSSMRQVMATREDLKELVTLAQYQADQRAASDRSHDHAQRITNAEQEVRALKDELHQVQLSDARQFRDLQVGTQQQIGQAQVAVVQQGAQAQNAAGAMVGKVKDILLGALFSAFTALLVAYLTHPH